MIFVFTVAGAAKSALCPSPLQVRREILQSMLSAIRILLLSAKVLPVEFLPFLPNGYCPRVELSTVLALMMPFL